jgi:hypothetical protein
MWHARTNPLQAFCSVVTVLGVAMHLAARSISSRWLALRANLASNHESMMPTMQSADSLFLIFFSPFTWPLETASLALRTHVTADSAQVRLPLNTSRDITALTEFGATQLRFTPKGGKSFSVLAPGYNVPLLTVNVVSGPVECAGGGLVYAVDALLVPSPPKAPAGRPTAAIATAAAAAAVATNDSIIQQVMGPDGAALASLGPREVLCFTPPMWDNPSCYTALRRLSTNVIAMTVAGTPAQTLQDICPLMFGFCRCVGPQGLLLSLEPMVLGAPCFERSGLSWKGPACSKHGAHRARLRPNVRVGRPALVPPVAPCNRHSNHTHPACQQAVLGATPMPALCY